MLLKYKMIHWLSGNLLFIFFPLVFSLKPKCHNIKTTCMMLNCFMLQEFADCVDVLTARTIHAEPFSGPVSVYILLKNFCAKSNSHFSFFWSSIILFLSYIAIKIVKFTRQTDWTNLHCSISYLELEFHPVTICFGAFGVIIQFNVVGSSTVMKTKSLKRVNFGPFYAVKTPPTC